MSNFMTLCKESVVVFETRVKQHIQTVEEFGSGCFHLEAPRLSVPARIVRPTNGAASNELWTKGNCEGANKPQHMHMCSLVACH